MQGYVTTEKNLSLVSLRTNKTASNKLFHICIRGKTAYMPSDVTRTLIMTWPQQQWFAEQIAKHDQATEPPSPLDPNMKIRNRPLLAYAYNNTWLTDVLMDEGAQIDAEVFAAFMGKNPATTERFWQAVPADLNVFGKSVLEIAIEQDTDVHIIAGLIQAGAEVDREKLDEQYGHYSSVITALFDRRFQLSFHQFRKILDYAGGPNETEAVAMKMIATGDSNALKAVAEYYVNRCRDPYYNFMLFCRHIAPAIILEAAIKLKNLYIAAEFRNKVHPKVAERLALDVDDPYMRHVLNSTSPFDDIPADMTNPDN